MVENVYSVDKYIEIRDKSDYLEASDFDIDDISSKSQIFLIVKIPKILMMERKILSKTIQ